MASSGQSSFTGGPTVAAMDPNPRLITLARPRLRPASKAIEVRRATDERRPVGKEFDDSFGYTPLPVATANEVRRATVERRLVGKDFDDSFVYTPLFTNWAALVSTRAGSAAMLEP